MEKDLMAEFFSERTPENLGKLYGQTLNQLIEGARYSSKIYNVDYKNDGLQKLAVKLVDAKMHRGDFKLTAETVQQIGTLYAETLNQIIEGANSTGRSYNEKSDHVGPEALAVQLVSDKILPAHTIPHGSYVTSALKSRAATASGKTA